MKNVGEVWQKAKENFSAEVNPIAAQQWIGAMEPVRLEDNVVYFSIPSEFERDIVVTRYKKNIEKALFSVLGFEVQAVVYVQQEQHIDDGPEIPLAKLFNPNSPAGENNIASWTFKNYTFDSFVVGGGNALAHAAAMAVAERPGTAYNPLFIYGDSGLGKTHLMCAIGNAIKKRRPDANVIYVTSETFLNELIRAVREEDNLRFKDKYRAADVLLIDDIQFISGKTMVQEEFFHTFNALYNAGKQIVMTSDRPPKEIATLDERLRTRFESGYTVDVTVPAYEVRCAIIMKKAEACGLQISREVVDFLASSLKDNVRQLEGAVMKIRAHHSLSHEPITREMVRLCIADIINDDEPLEKKLDRILNEVARFYNVPVDAVLGTSRLAKYANARKVAMYLVREITELSYPLIGEKFSGRNHTTVMYNINEVTTSMKTDYQLKSEISDLLKNLRS